MKIFLSPSNQDGNRYAYGNTTERDQCGYIAEKLKIALERCGFEVMLMHDEDMETKVNAADRWGADLYIPIHTNAFNGSVMGTRMFFGQTGGEGEKLCKAIFARLAPITPGTSENYRSYPELYEIGNPDAWSAYIEVEFHDAPEGAKWIVEHIEEIGEAICQGVCDYAGTSYTAPMSDSDTAKPEGQEHSHEAQHIYRVQVGAYRNYANAVRVRDELIKEGYVDAYIRV